MPKLGCCITLSVSKPPQLDGSHAEEGYRVWNGVLCHL